jgi:putative intracellular protease/amidase
MYILDTLADWEIGFITAELASKRFLSKNRNLNFVKIGNTLNPITTMGGMVITPDRDMKTIVFQEGDMLILPGADTWMDEKNQGILDIAADIIDKNVTVAAICGGTTALASKGLLDNRKHTSNGSGFLDMFCPNYKGTTLYSNAPAITDGNLITASSFAPLEFAYEVFKKLDVMKPETLEAWFKLNSTREPESFYALMESLK